MFQNSKSKIQNLYDGLFIHVRYSLKLAMPVRTLKI